jgi:hypothetical protein
MATYTFTATTAAATIFDCTNDGGEAHIISITADEDATTPVLATVEGLTADDPVPPGKTMPYMRGYGGVRNVSVKTGTGTATGYLSITARR